jgi:hypothetical protein
MFAWPPPDLPVLSGKCLRSLRDDKETPMKIKTNLRAGSGGASGAGHNSSGDSTSTTTAPPPVVYYPATRCVGL